MSRRRYSEKDVIRTLIHQGVKICDFRTGEPITLENVGLIEREHLHELKLGGPDEPSNCRYSLKSSHAIVTNGTKATTAGSSKNKLAKANNPNRKVNFIVNKPAPGEPKPAIEGKRIWPSKKLESAPFRKAPEGYSHWRGNRNKRHTTGRERVNG